jgi:hypothetical protein
LKGEERNGSQGRPEPPQRPRDSSRGSSTSSTSHRPSITRERNDRPDIPRPESPARRRGGRRDSPDYSPANQRRETSTTGRATQARDRGSPDYGLGSERRDRVPESSAPV